jgi:hypothetical protein
MPDQLCLSLWLRGFGQKNMLRHYRELLSLFPFSRLRPGVSALRIYAIEFSEPALYEQAFAGEVDLDTVVGLAAEFESSDCAYIGCSPPRGTRSQELSGCWYRDFSL